MDSSVKITEDTKNILDALQARITLRAKTRVSQQRLLEEAIKLSEENEDQLIRRLTGAKTPTTPEEIEKYLSKPRDWGVDTNEDDIDHHLYGVEKTPRKHHV